MTTLVTNFSPRITKIGIESLVDPSKVRCGGFVEGSSELIIKPRNSRESVGYAAWQSVCLRSGGATIYNGGKTSKVEDPNLLKILNVALSKKGLYIAYFDVLTREDSYKAEDRVQRLEFSGNLYWRLRA